jgi:hypothetical protein
VLAGKGGISDASNAGTDEVEFDVSTWSTVDGSDSDAAVDATEECDGPVLPGVFPPVQAEAISANATTYR